MEASIDSAAEEEADVAAVDGPAIIGCGGGGGISRPEVLSALILRIPRHPPHGPLLDQVGHDKDAQERSETLSRFGRFGARRLSLT